MKTIGRSEVIPWGLSCVDEGFLRRVYFCIPLFVWHRIGYQPHLDEKSSGWWVLRLNFCKEWHRLRVDWGWMLLKADAAVGELV